MGEEVEIGLPSFLLPVSTRSYRQGTGNGERVYDSGNLLVQLFFSLIANSFIVTSPASLAHAHTPRTSSLVSFLFSMSRFHLRLLCGSDKDYTVSLHYSPPPRNQHIHPSGLNATAVCVCACVRVRAHTRAGLCVCECVTAISVRDCNATLPHILCLSLVCLEREKKREREINKYRKDHFRTGVSERCVFGLIFCPQSRLFFQCYSVSGLYVSEIVIDKKKRRSRS